jgi:DNA invertase Pin-like site-specific DNA recombinase
MKQAPRKVLSLVRVATTGQTKKTTDLAIQRQQEEIAMVCEDHNLEVAKDGAYLLAPMSGTAVLKSPEYQTMLKRLKEPGIAGVVVPTVDRLGRNLSDVAAVTDTIQAAGAKIFCDIGELDPSTSQGRNTMYMFIAVVSFQRQKLGRRRNTSKKTLTFYDSNGKKHTIRRPANG